MVAADVVGGRDPGDSVAQDDHPTHRRVGDGRRCLALRSDAWQPLVCFSHCCKRLDRWFGRGRDVGLEGDHDVAEHPGGARHARMLGESQPLERAPLVRPGRREAVAALEDLEGSLPHTPMRQPGSIGTSAARQASSRLEPAATSNTRPSGSTVTEKRAARRSPPGRSPARRSRGSGERRSGMGTGGSPAVGRSAAAGVAHGVPVRPPWGELRCSRVPGSPDDRALPWRNRRSPRRDRGPRPVLCGRDREPDLRALRPPGQAALLAQRDGQPGERDSREDQATFPDRPRRRLPPEQLRHRARDDGHVEPVEETESARGEDRRGRPGRRPARQLVEHEEGPEARQEEGGELPEDPGHADGVDRRHREEGQREAGEGAGEQPPVGRPIRVGVAKVGDEGSRGLERCSSECNRRTTGSGWARP